MRNLINEWFDEWGPEFLAVIVALLVLWGIFTLGDALTERDLQRNTIKHAEYARRDSLLGKMVWIHGDSLMIIDWDNFTYTLSDGKEYNKLLIDRSVR